MDIVTLLGVKIDRASLDKLLELLANGVECDTKTIIAYVNIHTLNLAHETTWIKDFVNQSALSFCDGVGIKLAAAFTGQRLEHRFTPPDFIERVCDVAIQRGWRLYFLGARPGVAARAAGAMRSKFPGLQIDSHHGYFDKSTESVENTAMVTKINAFRPDILVVGFGTPLQERWILDNLDSLMVNVLFPAGALFDYLSGSVPRAPRWMTDHGLEWLGRLVVEPRRLWRRYIVGNPLLFIRLVMHHWLRVPLPE
jgi:N-acetylglucosaminyldiphosphoundecaprenol N-acetyl-beta-D-mannosaminyltransferase